MLRGLPMRGGPMPGRTVRYTQLFAPGLDSTEDIRGAWLPRPVQPGEIVRDGGLLIAVQTSASLPSRRHDRHGECG